MNNQLVYNHRSVFIRSIVYWSRYLTIEQSNWYGDTRSPEIEWNCSKNNKYYIEMMDAVITSLRVKGNPPTDLMQIFGKGVPCEVRIADPAVWPRRL